MAGARPVEVDPKLAGAFQAGWEEGCELAAAEYESGFKAGKEAALEEKAGLERDLAKIVSLAQQAFTALVRDDRSTVTFDRSADDPENPYYWEIDDTRIRDLAEALGLPLPEGKNPET